jgi:hypothetical protein
MSNVQLLRLKNPQDASSFNIIIAVLVLAAGVVLSAAWRSPRERAEPQSYVFLR